MAEIKENRMRAICFGSLNIDYSYRVPHFVGAGETVTSEGLRVNPGGKGLNQAIALARAGASVWMAGNIGEDGRLLTELLEKNRINTSLVEIRTEVRTGNAIIQNDARGDNCILLYPGANRAVTTEQIRQVFQQCESGDWIFLQNEINGLPEIITAARQKEMTIVLNPSPLDERLRECNFADIDWLILNEGEAQNLCRMQGKIMIPERYPELLHTLAELLPNIRIILTVGEAGSYLWDGDKEFFAPACHVQAVDTTAAGDTYTGYVFAALMNGEHADQAMQRATQAAAVTVTRRGAAESIPIKEELNY